MHKQQNLSPIAATVDAEGTLKNLERIFSSSSSCITELMQNSRRAGATKLNVSVITSEPVCTKRAAFGKPEVLDFESHIESIIIEDNGCGIDDFSQLFRFSNSGWSGDIKSKEHSFGVGFFSVLYYAQTVSVESNGVKHTFTKDSILNGEGSVVEESEVTSGTRIQLSLVHQRDTKNFIDAMRGFAMSYPLDVHLKADYYTNQYPEILEDDIEARLISVDEVLNASLLPSVLSEDTDYARVDFKFGFAFVPKEQVLTKGIFSLSQVTAFLQSLPIGIECGYKTQTLPTNFKSGLTVVAFLNDDVPATHPDRNFVHADVAKEVEEALKTAVIELSTQLFRKKIFEVLDSDNETKYRFLTNNSYNLHQDEFKDLLPLFGALPSETVYEVVDNIAFLGMHFEAGVEGLVTLETEYDVITQEWVEETNPLFVMLSPDDSGVSNASYTYILAREFEKNGRKVLVLSADDSKHYIQHEWVTSRLLDFYNCEIDVEIIGDSHSQPYEFSNTYIDADFVDGVSIKIRTQEDSGDPLMFNFDYQGNEYYVLKITDCGEKYLYVPYLCTDIPALYNIELKSDDWGNLIDITNEEENEFDKFIALNKKFDKKESLKEAFAQFLKSLEHTRLEETLKNVKVEVCRGQVCVI